MYTDEQCEDIADEMMERLNPQPKEKGLMDLFAETITEQQVIDYLNREAYDRAMREFW